MERSSDDWVEEGDTVEIAEPFGPVRAFLPLELWFPFSMLCGFVVAVVVLKRSRTRNIVRHVCLIAASLALCLAIWYVYPSMTYEGTYFAKLDYGGESCSSFIEIGGHFTCDGHAYGPCRVIPLQRMLWVTMPEGCVEDFMPVKLGWHSISVPIMKVGWVKYRKQRGQGEPAVGADSR